MVENPSVRVTCDKCGISEEFGLTPLARCIAEQARCAEYLRGDGPDKEGAWRGLCDWLMEEVLVRQTEMVIYLRRDPPPVPTGAFDWQGAVEGREERWSVAGPTPWACLRELADLMEEEG